MTNPAETLPNETYFEGLRNADAGIIEAIYTAFRKPIIRAVEAAGGTSSDGATFFRVAVIQASVLAHNSQLKEETPISLLLKELAVAHFQDWATEKGVGLPPRTPAETTEVAVDLELPGPDARLVFRQHIRAKRQFSKLDGDCQKIVQELANDAALGITDPRLESAQTESCLEKYRQSLGDTEPAWSTQLPTWVVTALSDQPFEKVWSAAESMEKKLTLEPAVAPGVKKNNLTRNVLIVLYSLVIGYGIWSYLTPAASPAAVYEENFKPPASIMADRAARLAKDTLPAERNEVCEQLFEQADQQYQNKAYAETASILYTMIGEEMEPCNSDALFYLGIIGLQLEEPEMTVRCFAKIPDLDRFGEDLYWYQALAFVKIAAQNPARRDVARRAVERARSNTEMPERRAQAEKMLEELK